MKQNKNKSNKIYIKLGSHFRCQPIIATRLSTLNSHPKLTSFFFTCIFLYFSCVFLVRFCYDCVNLRTVSLARLRSMTCCSSLTILTGFHWVGLVSITWLISYRSDLMLSCQTKFQIEFIWLIIPIAIDVLVISLLDIELK